MRIFIALPLCLTACASFPQVDAAVSKASDPRPALLTLDQMNSLRAQPAAPAENDLAAAQDLRARALELRSR